MMNKVAKKSSQQTNGTPKVEKKTSKTPMKTKAKEIQSEESTGTVEMATAASPGGVKKVTPRRVTRNKAKAGNARMNKEAEPLPKKKVSAKTGRKRVKEESVEEDSEESEEEHEERVDTEPSPKKRKAEVSKKQTPVKKKVVKEESEEDEEEESDDEDEGMDEEEAQGGHSEEEEDKHSEEDSDEDDSVTFYVANLPTPFTAGLKHRLQAYFDGKGIKVQLRGHNVKKKVMSYCHADLQNPNDREKMEDLNGQPFEDKELKIDFCVDSISLDKKRVILFDPDLDAVSEHELKEASGAQDVFVWKSMCVAFLGFDDEAAAKEVVDAGTITVGGSEVIAQYAKSRRQKEDDGEKKTEKINKRSGRIVCFNCNQAGHVLVDCPSK